jgi:hypothetical protein
VLSLLSITLSPEFIFIYSCIYPDFPLRYILGCKLQFIYVCVYMCGSFLYLSLMQICTIYFIRDRNQYFLCLHFYKFYILKRMFIFGKVFIVFYHVVMIFL